MRLVANPGTELINKFILNPFYDIHSINPILSSTFLTGVCYFCASRLLLHRPSLVHQKKLHRGKRFDSLIIGHRGSRLEGIPENTLPAFKHALEYGAETIELDVWLTADQEVVVFHDGDLQRMTGEAGHVQNLPYHQLPLIPYEYDGQITEVAIPRLKDVLEAVPAETPMIIEFKTDSQDLIDRVHAHVTSSGHINHLVWFSLQSKINQRLAFTDPNIPRVTCVPQMLRLICLYHIGLLPFVKIEEEIFGVPIDEVNYARIRDQKALKSLPDWVCKVLAFFFGGKPPKLLIPKKMMMHLRKRGMPVWFLGVNDEADINVALQAGATGLLTDKPKFVSEYIKKRFGKQN